MHDIFSGLDNLGFNNIDNVELYAKKDEETTNNLADILPKEDTYLYDKKVTCPVCGQEFTVKAVKSSYYRMKSKDSDFFIRYELVNPYFYDVWLCNNCGYAAMKVDFLKIRNFQKEEIKKNITSRWKGKFYTVPYNINTAIERYKLSLLSYYYIDAKSSQKAMNCLKLAWMCRLNKDKKSEQEYLIQSLKGFNDAYFSEEFPIYGMNKYTTMYLIGELNRRTGNTEDALLWFSKVITTPNINRRLKELARDQKDIIKSSKLEEEKNEMKQEGYSKSNRPNKSKGFKFFTSFFKK